MQRVNERRVKGGEVGAPLVILAFEGAQCGINAETAENDDNREDLDPPRVTAERVPEARFGHKSRGASHSVTSILRVADATTSACQMNFCHTSSTQPSQKCLNIRLV